MRAVDGSVLVGLLMCDDVGQPVYGTDSDRIATIVAMLLEHDRLVLQDPDVVRAALDDFRREPAVGFADCLIVGVARKLGHRPVGTFDRAMSRLDDAVAP